MVLRSFQCQRRVVGSAASKFGGKRDVTSSAAILSQKKNGVGALLNIKNIKMQQREGTKAQRFCKLRKLEGKYLESGRPFGEEESRKMPAKNRKLAKENPQTMLEKDEGRRREKRR
ncbi:uncharacterized protein LOC126747147 [Anthonomus grandis grandis]|uniref:uncharacterized protein LOC126747147 n=1 Tax=Anthonomus grandis grandis TaxID=2921223 RepID=UPI002165BDC5|nr:uncharacterized protein LOC126747147 [Anthonomus grandis grandis]